MFIHREEWSVNVFCPTRLAFSTIYSMIGKLRSIFVARGRSASDSDNPDFGNPAAAREVKNYLASVREEQLQAGGSFLSLGLECDRKFD